MREGVRCFGILTSRWPLFPPRKLGRSEGEGHEALLWILVGL